MPKVPRSPRQAGATMIEVLVALFVLSVGLLGVAAMQQVGLRNSHSAQLRGQATALAADIADRMRANVVRARAGDYNIEFDGDTDADPDVSAVPDVADCVDSPSAAQQVACDLAQWRAALATTLPAGTGRVEVQEPANGIQLAQIEIRWDDSRGEFDPIVFETWTQL